MGWLWVGATLGVSSLGVSLYLLHRDSVAKAWAGGVRFGRGIAGLSAEEIAAIVRSCREGK
jgi:hypothetical protein